MCSWLFHKNPKLCGKQQQKTLDLLLSITRGFLYPHPLYLLVTAFQFSFGDHPPPLSVHVVWKLLWTLLVPAQLRLQSPSNWFRGWHMNLPRPIRVSPGTLVGIGPELLQLQRKQLFENKTNSKESRERDGEKQNPKYLAWAPRLSHTATRYIPGLFGCEPINSLSHLS